MCLKIALPVCVRACAPALVVLLSTVAACTFFAKPKIVSADQPLTSNLNPAPIKWDDIAASYSQVKSYQCLYEKEERAISNGELQIIRVSFRKPFDVRLDWLDDRGKVDQSAVYRTGFNEGKLLARQYGLIGAIAGTLRLDPAEQAALADSKHPITEIGIGKIIERAQHDAAGGRMSLKFVGEELINSRSAYRFEFIPKNSDGVAGLPEGRRAVVWVDKEFKLPTRLEIYDGANTLLERHVFKDLQLNVNLSDKTFTL